MPIIDEETISLITDKSAQIRYKCLCDIRQESVDQDRTNDNKRRNCARDFG